MNASSVPSFALRVMRLAGVLVALYLLALAFNVTPWLRGPDEWRWNYALPGTLARLWLPALLLVGYVLAVQWLRTRTSESRYRIVALIAAMIMTPALQLALLYMDHTDVRSQLFYRTVSVSSGGFFNVGAVVDDTDDFLRHFVEHMASYPIHPQRHPPGLPVLFAWTHQFFQQHPDLAARINDVLRPYQCHNLALMNLSNSTLASAALQMSAPFLLGLVVWPLYALGRAVYNRETAVRAALLWPLLPSVALWATRWNQLYALFTVFAFLALHRGLVSRRSIYFYVSGLVVSLASFFSLGHFSLIVFLGMYAMVHVWVSADRPRRRELLIMAGLFALGVATVWSVLLVIAGLNLFDLWRVAIGIHLSVKRTYVIWLFYHLYDFFVFLGIPLLVLWSARLIQTVRGIRLRQKPIDIWLISFAIALLLFDLSGLSLGEVARVWAFLLPIPLLAAVRALPKHSALFTALAALLALQVFVGNIFLRTVGTGLSDPPTPPAVAGIDAESTRTRAVWEGGITLDQAQVSSSDDGVLEVRAVWSTTQQIYLPYTLFVHVVDEHGQIVTQYDAMPREDSWLTTCWQPGQPFEDVYRLEIPQALAAQPYRVLLGWYWLPSLERLNVNGPGAQPDRSVDIGGIEGAAGHD